MRRNRVSITVKIDIWRKKKYNYTRKIVNHEIVFGRVLCFIAEMKNRADEFGVIPLDGDESNNISGNILF